MAMISPVFVATFLILIVLVPLWIYLCILPGQIAKARGHSAADAVMICGLVGMVFPPAFIVALIWAHTQNRGGGMGGGGSYGRDPHIVLDRLRYGPPPKAKGFPVIQRKD